MTTSTTTKPIRLTDKIVRHASTYRRLCGFDAFAQESSGRIILRTGAIELPPALCQRVIAAMLWPGPTIVSAGDPHPTATILTGPIPLQLRHASTHAALSAAGAQLVADGDEVLLPSPRDPARRWLPYEPLDPYRPSAQVVVTTILACR
ncbi:hypothetical protein [Nocardia sp. NPDC060259]|uniref:hypothetical protein n=1 Tax=Nocardia sp. NPDC060259 TaxID=3347088 RepID=UPI00364A91C7